MDETGASELPCCLPRLVEQVDECMSREAFFTESRSKHFGPASPCVKEVIGFWYEVAFPVTVEAFCLSRILHCSMMLPAQSEIAERFFFI